MNPIQISTIARKMNTHALKAQMRGNEAKFMANVMKKNIVALQHVPKS